MSRLFLHISCYQLYSVIESCHDTSFPLQYTKVMWFCKSKGFHNFFMRVCAKLRNTQVTVTAWQVIQFPRPLRHEKVPYDNLFMPKTHTGNDPDKKKASISEVFHVENIPKQHCLFDLAFIWYGPPWSHDWTASQGLSHFDMSCMYYKWNQK